ncbi:MAG: LPS export ABC transporter permease LptG [Succinivibrionaceae bacterium]|nr:LPS export ABC transporter permease LptG [Succinivibrionaceae bacterium]
MMLRILDRYVGRTVLFSILLVSVCLTFLMALVTFVDHLRYLGRGDVDFAFLLEYLAYEIPGMVVLFFPVAVLIGGVIGLGMMARSSEIIILQSIGMSRMGIIMSALKTQLPLIVLMMVVSELVVPPCEQRAEARYNEVAKAGQIAVTHNGLWLREGNTFIGIAQILSDDTLRGVTRYVLEHDRIISMSSADSGAYADGHWVMQNVTVNSFDEEGKVRIERRPTDQWHLNLTPDRVEVVGVKGYYLTMKGLWDYVRYLEENHQDASQYRLELYTKICSPFTVVVVLLLAASTVFGPLRTMTMGARVLAGITLGFGFYVLNQVVAPFSLVYGLPPSLGATLPTVIFAALAVFLLRRKA